MFGNISASLIFGTSNAQVVGSSPTRSSIAGWNVAIRLGEPPIKSPTQKGVQDNSNYRKRPLAFQLLGIKYLIFMETWCNWQH